jgi:hypothetical protein
MSIFDLRTLLKQEIDTLSPELLCSVRDFLLFQKYKDTILPPFNTETKEAIQESRDISDGKIHTKRFTSIDEIFEGVDSETE